MFEKEMFTVARPYKISPSVEVAWVFPNTYEVGMSSLGYQLVWWMLEQDSDTHVRRVFSDCAEPEWENSELVGFTFSWELDFINMFRILDQIGLKQLSIDRGDEDALVFGGGPVLTANPEPFANFFDVIILGDAEVGIPKFLQAWKQVRHLKRQEQLLSLAQVEGLYVPSFYKYELSSQRGPIDSITPLANEVPELLSKQVFSPATDYVAHSYILSPEATWANTFLVEVARSCPQECRFCLASFLTRPFRATDVNALIAAIDGGLKHTSRIGLLGASVTEHPQFDQIAEALLQRTKIDVSIASVRADSLNPLILQMLKQLGQRSVTIAMESGSERLRAVMKKNLTEQELFNALELIDRSGLDGVKLYGMVGLPQETAEDLDETIRVMTALKKLHKRLRFVFGCSSFVPKAQTPFQWFGRDSKSKDKLEFVRKKLAPIGIDVRPESHNWSDIQALLSRGDRRLTPILQTVASGKGNIGAWNNALRNLPEDCPPRDFYVFRHINYDEVLPWSHIVESAKVKILLRHSQQAAQAAAYSATNHPLHDLPG